MLREKMHYPKPKNTTMRKIVLFCFILPLVLISCNNSDQAKQKIIEAITTDFKEHNKNVYEKLDSIHVVSYDSLTEKKYLNFTYDRMLYQKRFLDTLASGLNNTIQEASHLKEPFDQRNMNNLNTIISARQNYLDSSHAIEARMQTTAASYKVADSVHYYGFIVKAVLYVTTAEVTSAPYNQIIIIDKNNEVRHLKVLPPFEHFVDSVYKAYGNPFRE